MPASLNFETGNASFVGPCISPAPDAGTSQLGFETGNFAFASPCTSFPPVNLAPVVNAGPDRTALLSNGALTLNGAVQDDGLPGVALTALWSQVSGPSGFFFASPASPITIASFTKPGAYRLRLTGSDSVLTAFDETVLMVTNPGGSLSVNAGPDQTISLGNNAVLIGALTPTGPDASSFWRQISGPGIAVISSPFSLTTTATLPVIGTYTFELFGSDGNYTAVGTTSVLVRVDTGSVPYEVLYPIWDATTSPPVVAVMPPVPPGNTAHKGCLRFVEITDGAIIGILSNPAGGTITPEVAETLLSLAPPSGSYYYAVNFYGYQSKTRYKPRTRVFTPSSTRYKIYQLNYP